MPTTQPPVVHYEGVHTQPWTCMWSEGRGRPKRGNPGTDVPLWRCTHPAWPPKNRTLEPGACDGCKHWERAPRTDGRGSE
jgi:hypothetical protein